VQFEFGFTLGPPDGRYLVRAVAEGPVQAVLVLGAEGRATVVRSSAFGSVEEAADWLAELQADKGLLDDEVRSALTVVNRALRSWRASTADPYVGELSFERTQVARIGYGAGEAVADGRLDEAMEVPRPKARRVKRSMEAPEERFAALLGAREPQLVAEELVLRARADLNAGRGREAALQARVALESLGGLPEHRDAVGRAANAALAGDLDDGELQALTEAVKGMEVALRRHRLGG
jgi:hypothetical protein